MSRGSFRRRLPRGRCGLTGNPILLGLALFLLLLIPAVFYLFPHQTDSQPTSAPDLLDDDAPAYPLQTAPAKTANITDPILKVASIEAEIQATVNLLQSPSQVHLENTGSVELSHVELQGSGKTLGILSQLAPGEKKVLALSSPVEDVAVLALDPSGREVSGEVNYLRPPAIDVRSAARGG